MSRLVIGIDPGLERLGWGLVAVEGSILTLVDHGLIKTPRTDTPTRLLQIYRDLKAVVGEHSPDEAACERLFFAKNTTTGIDVAKAAGVAQLALVEAGLACVELSPPEVKLAVVGVGNAEKHQVGFMVCKLLGLQKPPKPDDVADAVAVALAQCLKSPATR